MPKYKTKLYLEKEARRQEALPQGKCNGRIEAIARAQRSRKIPYIENTKLKKRRREREGKGIKEGNTS